MDVALASKVEGDYLLTQVRGRIANLSELKQLTQRFYAEILKYGLTKILIDERDTTFPRSVEHSIELVHYLSEDFPEEIRSWKIALVMDSHFKPIGDFF